MSNQRDVMDELTADIELYVIMGATENVTLIEKVRRELLLLREFKKETKEQLKMAMFAYSKNDDFYVKGIIEELIKLEQEASK